MAKYKPNTYVLGGKVRLKAATTDPNDNPVVPIETRLSIKQPDGAIITYSGGDLVIASGYQYILYRPPTIGWYEYEGWVKDAVGGEDADTHGFEVVDRVY
jgi:hypothetical protein